MKNAITKTALAATLAMGGVIVPMPANAALFGTASIATERTQLISWAAQYQQMVQEFQQLVETYNSLNGARGVEKLLDNKSAREYLPGEFQDILKNGYSNWKELEREYTNVTNHNDLQKQRIETAAKMEAAQQAGYREAGKRFEAIQKLIDKMQTSTDAKDIQDLTAAIATEQANIQNERNKMAMLQQLAATEDKKNDQRAIELTRQSGRANGALFNFSEAEAAMDSLGSSNKKMPTALK